jgi:hypothetical protein
LLEELYEFYVATDRSDRLDGPIDVAPQELGPPPRREGFTLVEWGGLRR